MTGGASPGGERVRAAEVIAALSLATDLGIGFPLEHGLQSTLFAMRLAERLGVDRETASQTYYACLLLHVGCTADAHVAAEIFGDGSTRCRGTSLPVMFGSQREMIGRAAARAGRAGQPARRCAPLQIARTLPRAARAEPQGMPPRSARWRRC